MKRYKMVIGRGLIVALLLQMLAITAFAADISLTLSKTNGYVGDSITLSGTSGAAEWITVKVLDGKGNIVYINAVQSGADGSYSDTFIVPDVEVGSLRVVAGYGADVVSADFTIKATPSGGYTGGKDEDDAEKAEITDADGNTIDGTVKDTETGQEITIKGNDFSTAANAGAIRIFARSVVITFDETAAKYIGEMAGSGDIVLTVEKVDTSELLGEAQELIGERPAYEFDLSAGGTAVSTFGGGLAYVNIPYTPKSDEENNKLVALLHIRQR